MRMVVFSAAGTRLLSHYPTRSKKIITGCSLGPKLDTFPYLKLMLNETEPKHPLNNAGRSRTTFINIILLTKVI